MNFSNKTTSEIRRSYTKSELQNILSTNKLEVQNHLMDGYCGVGPFEGEMSSARLSSRTSSQNKIFSDKFSVGEPQSCKSIVDDWNCWQRLCCHF